MSMPSRIAVIHGSPEDAATDQPGVLDADLLIAWNGDHVAPPSLLKAMFGSKIRPPAGLSFSRLTRIAISPLSICTKPKGIVCSQSECLSTCRCAGRVTQPPCPSP